MQFNNCNIHTHAFHCAGYISGGNSVITLNVTRCTDENSCIGSDNDRLLETGDESLRNAINADTVHHVFMI